MICYTPFVRCDRCGERGPSGDNSDDARAAALAGGWGRRPVGTEGGRDFCPNCVKIAMAS